MSGTDPDRLRVGVVGGTRLPGNVATFLENVGALLADHDVDFDCDLLVADGVDVPEGYRPVDPGFAETTRALGTLRTLTTGITRYAAETDVDVLFQVTKFPVHGCATTIAGRRTGTPVLARFAGDNLREYRLSAGVDRAKAFALNNGLGRVPVHFADRILVLGPHGGDEISGRNGGASVETIPQPVDRERFAPVDDGRRTEIRTDLGVGDDERALLTVGRLTERKGMDAVAATADAVADRDDSVHWLVVGEGPYRERLAARPNVEVVGRVPHDRIVEYYRGADLLVHPSRIEGLPNTLLEAAACGLPSLARDTGDCAVAASAVFDGDDELPGAVLGEYDAVTLGERFDPDWQREAYARALVETATESRPGRQKDRSDGDPNAES